MLSLMANDNSPGGPKIKVPPVLIQNLPPIASPSREAPKGLFEDDFQTRFQRRFQMLLAREQQTDEADDGWLGQRCSLADYKLTPPLTVAEGSFLRRLSLGVGLPAGVAESSPDLAVREAGALYEHITRWILGLRVTRTPARESEEGERLWRIEPTLRELGLVEPSILGRLVTVRQKANRLKHDVTESATLQGAREALWLVVAYAAQIATFVVSYQCIKCMATEEVFTLHRMIAVPTLWLPRCWRCEGEISYTRTGVEGEDDWGNDTARRRVSLVKKLLPRDGNVVRDFVHTALLADQTG